jgi:hypothetical protein
VEGLGVLADDQGEVEVGHWGEEGVAPGRGAFGARGKVAGCAGAGIAEAHREDRDEFGVMELFDREAVQARRRSPLASATGIPVSWTLRPGACPAIRIRARGVH